MSHPPKACGRPPPPMRYLKMNQLEIEIRKERCFCEERGSCEDGSGTYAGTEKTYDCPATRPCR